jgi:hypothetical protein
VAKAKVKNDRNYNLIRMDRCGRQTIKPRKLMQKAGVEIPVEGAGIQ